MDKKCKKFLKALAQKLYEGAGEGDIKNKTLRKVFTKAILGLPEGHIKTVLKDNFLECFELLKTQIKKVKEKTHQTFVAVNEDAGENGIKGISKPEEEEEEKDDEEEDKLSRMPVENASHDFPYNFYLKDNKPEFTTGLNNTTENIYFLNKIQSDDNPGSAMKHVKEFQRMTKEKTIMSALDCLLILTSGIKDATLIKKLLFVYLTKMQPLVEKYLAEDNINKATLVQENLHKFLYVSHMRYYSSQTKVNEEKPSYRDLIASLLSVYLDLSVFLFRKDEKKIRISRLLYSFVSFLTDNFPAQKFDVLLQLTQTEDDQIELLYPLIQYCVEKKVDNNDAPAYIKYILSVVLTSKASQQTRLTFQDAIRRARSVIPPTDVNDWLEQHEVTEVSDFIDNNNNLSTFLLDNVTDSLQVKLIDSLCDEASVDVDEKEGVEGVDEVLVFNPLLSESSFFTSHPSAESDDSMDDNMEDLFVVDKKGTKEGDKKKKSRPNTEGPNAAFAIDAESVSNNNSSPKKSNLKRDSAFTPNSDRKVAIVSPNRKIKSESSEDSDQMEIGDVEQNTLNNSSKKMQFSPKLRSTVKYLNKSPPKAMSPPVRDTNLSTWSELIKSPTREVHISKQKSELQVQKQKSSEPPIKQSPSKKAVLSSELNMSTVQSTGLPTPKVNSHDQSFTKLQKLKSPLSSESKSPKLKSPAQLESKSLKLKSPAQLESKSPKLKSPELSDSKSPKLKSPLSSESKSPKLKSPAQSDSKSPKLKSPTQSDSKSPMLKSRKLSEIKSFIQSKKSQKQISPVKSGASLGPKVKSPKYVDAEKETISLSSENESKNDPVRTGTRVRKPSARALLTGLSGIKEYTIISDSENTDLESTFQQSRKRNSDVTDLTVHLNKTRKTSTSTDSDTPGKSKNRRKSAIVDSTINIKTVLKKTSEDLSVTTTVDSNVVTKTAKLSGKEMHSVLEKACNKLEVVKEGEILTETKKSVLVKVRSPIGLRRRSTSESSINESRSDDDSSTRTKNKATPAKRIKKVDDEEAQASKNQSGSPRKSDCDSKTKSPSSTKTPSKRYALRNR